MVLLITICIWAAGVPLGAVLWLIDKKWPQLALLKRCLVHFKVPAGLCLTLFLAAYALYSSSASDLTEHASQALLNFEQNDACTARTLGYIDQKLHQAEKSGSKYAGVIAFLSKSNREMQQMGAKNRQLAADLRGQMSEFASDKFNLVIYFALMLLCAVAVWGLLRSVNPQGRVVRVLLELLLLCTLCSALTFCLAITYLETENGRQCVLMDNIASYAQQLGRLCTTLQEQAEALKFPEP